MKLYLSLKSIQLKLTGMIIFKHYKFGFDIWAAVIFLAVMIPTIVWAFVPAPTDILRTESATPVVDAIGFAICHLVFAVVNSIR